MIAESNKNLNEVVEQGLQQYDPACFGAAAEAAKDAARDLARSIVHELASQVRQAMPGHSEDALLWRVRAVIAPLAQKLRWAMDRPFGRTVSGVCGGRTAEQVVVDLVRQQLDRAFAGEVPSELRRLIAGVVAREAARLPATDLITLGQMVRVLLAKVGVLLQRASACIWMMLIDKSHLPAETAVTPKAGPASQEDGAVYLKSLQEFATKLDL